MQPLSSIIRNNNGEEKFIDEDNPLAIDSFWHSYFEYVSGLSSLSLYGYRHRNDN